MSNLCGARSSGVRPFPWSSPSDQYNNNTERADEPINKHHNIDSVLPLMKRGTRFLYFNLAPGGEQPYPSRIPLMPQAWIAMGHSGGLDNTMVDDKTKPQYSFCTRERGRKIKCDQVKNLYPIFNRHHHINYLVDTGETC